MQHTEIQTNVSRYSCLPLQACVCKTVRLITSYRLIQQIVLSTCTKSCQVQEVSDTVITRFAVTYSQFHIIENRTQTFKEFFSRYSPRKSSGRKITPAFAFDEFSRL